jgi:glutaredoxin
MKFRNLVILGIVGFFVWKHLHPDVSKLRVKAGIDPNDVVMLSVTECGAVCTDQAKMIEKRGVHVVTFDVDTDPEGGVGKRLWQAIGSPNRFPSFLIGKTVFSGGQQDLRSVLVAEMGDRVLRAPERIYFSAHFTNQVPQATLYTAPWCGYCKALRADLKASGTPFKEIDVESHRSRDTLTEVMEIDGYPAVYFGYERLNGAPNDLANQIRSRIAAL